MREFEQGHQLRFKILVTHDAEDWIHPDSLRLINWFSRDHEMVQIPVQPLPTHPADVTHGLYCDEFAEYQCNDIPVRQRLGGFLPSNGGLRSRRDGTSCRVAPGSDVRSRVPHGGLRDWFPFASAGVPADLSAAALRRFGADGYPRVFPAPISQFRSPAQPVGGRHRAARLAAPWMAGTRRQIYWFRRDRKGLVGNLLSPLANFFCLYGAASLLWTARMGTAWHLSECVPSWLSGTCWATLLISVLQGGLRTQASARIYGKRFAAGVPARILRGNLVNCAATVAAIRQFAVARIRGRGLAWRMTDHAYPVAQFRLAISEATQFQGIDGAGNPPSMPYGE